MGGAGNKEGRINTKVVDGVERKLSSETEVTVFRIVQEALSNVRHHSGATEAVVMLKFAPESLKMTIQDNGKGFLFSKMNGNLIAQGRLGIIGMQERTRFLNGTFNVSSQPGQGTLVSVDIMR